MGGRIAITREASGDDLRKQARRERDGKVALRLMAIAAVLDGARRHVAARQGGMDRQTLRDWVHRFNADGVEGLRDRPGGHPVRRLTAEQEARVRAFVLSPPDPDKDRLVRWRCVDVQAYIAATFKDPSQMPEKIATRKGLQAMNRLSIPAGICWTASQHILR